MRVAVIGGGASGLFAARLLALRHPDWRITVYERLEPSGTFGFGIGLSGAALASVERVDPETRAAIEQRAFSFRTAEFRLPRGSLAIPGFHRGVSIARTGLLVALVGQAEAAGVEVRVGGSADVAALRPDHDLVIAADGVSSASREAYREAFEPDIHLGHGRYIWCGSEAPLAGTIFAPIRTEDGVFCAHAYPYAPGRSTWVVETEAPALERAGLAGLADDAAPADPGASDERSLDYLTEAFQPMLNGHKLLGNRSQWFRFRTLRCRTWVHGNVVLLGDASATADPSVGSGTKLALDSAIALVEALDGLDQGRSLDECLLAYESIRRPSVSRLQDWAVRSQLWWDSFPRRMDRLDLHRIAVAFLTRAGAVSLDDALSSGPGLVRAAVASWAGVDPAEVPERSAEHSASDLTRWIVDRPLHRDGLIAPRRLVDLDPGVHPETVDFVNPWGRRADALLARVRDGGPGVVVLSGTPDRPALLDRMQVAERLRLELDRPVAVTASAADSPDIAAALVAGRIDLAYLDQRPAE